MSTSRRLVLGLGGLLAGLVAAEAAASYRDAGAFPHVNFYIPDDVLGVRLAPGARQKIAFGGNPVTTLETNAQGYRAPEWPAAGEDEVVMVGDSQVFGLGVEAEDSLPAQLAAQSGRVVLNGGVPTYGPDEYLAAAEEIITARGGAVSDLVIVLNFSNDLFELGRPNRERHAVWDGWAIRIEGAPEGGLRFPGRRWLFSQSHLVFALRQWMHTPLPEDDLGFPSEGGLADLIVTAQAVHSERQDSTTAQEQERRAQAEAYTAAGEQAYDETALVGLLEELGYSDEETFQDAAGVRAITNNRAIGDIVTISYGEPSRSIEVTADLLRRGARVRNRLRQQVERAIRRTDGDEQSWYQERLPPQPMPVPEELLTEQVQAVLWGTPFDEFLDRAAAMEASHGVAVTNVTLPLDVQVLSSQFAKYEADPVDMSESAVLLDDVADASRRRGMRAINPLTAIQPVGDPAYLDNDLHLSAAGHAALAGAIGETLGQQPPLRMPGLGLPAGRSRVPVDEEFLAAGENLVRGSTKNRCATHAVREWFYMHCRDSPDEELAGVRLAQAPKETFGEIRKASLELWMPLFPGRDADVDVLWSERQEQLQVRWPSADGPPTLAFQPLASRPVEAVASPENSDLASLVGAASSCSSPDSTCSHGRRKFLPDCAPGEANAGSAGHCLTLCSEAAPCASGVCSEWQGGMVCL